MDVKDFKDSQAFPTLVLNKEELVSFDNGFTKREYAAMKLRVPNSGLPWLDEMIEQSLRDEFDSKAMQVVASYGFNSPLGGVKDFDAWVARRAHQITDAMLAARKGESS